MEEFFKSFGFPEINFDKLSERVSDYIDYLDGYFTSQEIFFCNPDGSLTNLSLAFQKVSISEPLIPSYEHNGELTSEELIRVNIDRGNQELINDLNKTRELYSIMGIELEKYVEGKENSMFSFENLLEAYNSMLMIINKTLNSSGYLSDLDDSDTEFIDPTGVTYSAFTRFIEDQLEI